MTETEAWIAVFEAIDARRLQFGWAKSHLYAVSGVSQTTLDAIRKGRPLLRLDKRAALCLALGWAPDAIDRLLDGAEPASVIAEDLRPEYVKGALERIDAIIAEIGPAIDPETGDPYDLKILAAKAKAAKAKAGPQSDFAELSERVSDNAMRLRTVELNLVLIEEMFKALVEREVGQ
jgi:hypothetical protein